METLDSGPYAQPQDVTSAHECLFYHTMDIPGFGTVKGYWDLRPNVRKYLGEVDLKNTRVLELGTASGYLCFYMESQGAEVIAFDLSENENPDLIPYARFDVRKRLAEHRDYMRKVRNGFWFAHRALGSRAKVVYGTAYAVPESIGPVDVSVFGTLLLHLRDPFLGLQSALRLTCETVIVTEPLDPRFGRQWSRRLIRRPESSDRMIFMPDAKSGEPPTSWWVLSPGVIKRFLAVLGFEDSQVTYHLQKREDEGEARHFTVVASRTMPMKG
jgi:hypothetical protein